MTFKEPSNTNSPPIWVKCPGEWSRGILVARLIVCIVASIGVWTRYDPASESAPALPVWRVRPKARYSWSDGSVYILNGHLNALSSCQLCNEREVIETYSCSR